jgi:hypothetical protein
MDAPLEPNYPVACDRYDHRDGTCIETGEPCPYDGDESLCDADIETMRSED